jgi:hypothetical protein
VPPNASHHDRGIAAFLASHQHWSKIRLGKHTATCRITSAKPFNPDGLTT